MELDFLTILAIFLVSSVVVTYLIKRFTGQSTYYIASLIKTRKPLAFFDAMARHRKFLDAFAALGLFLGFGALAVDFVYGRKMRKGKRALLFVASFSVLAGLLMLVDFLFGNVFSNNVLVGSAYPLMVVSFALLGLAGFTLFSLFLQAFDIIAKYLSGSRSCPGVAPLIPGVDIPGVPITPPLHAWFSLIIILLVHEGMHGILGRRHGFRVKSAGVILLGFLPVGAFVEPDEEELKSASDAKLLPFLAAGPMANLSLMLVVGLFLLGSFAAVGPLTEHFYPGLTGKFFSGVKVAGVLEGTTFCGTAYPSSAFGNFQEGDIITGVNGSRVSNPSDLYSLLQQDRLSEKTFTLERDGTTLELTLQPNDLGQFGFVPEGIRNEGLLIPESYYTYALAVTLFIEFLYWLFLLNFLIAAINFLPMHPFDGGRIAKVLFVPYLSFLGRTREERQKKISEVFMWGILALLLINALPLFI